MTPNNKHHESAPWARFALVVLLGMAAFMGGVLTLEAIRTSAVAMAYAACLVLMLAATWVFLLVAPVVGAAHGRERRVAAPAPRPRARVPPSAHEARPECVSLTGHRNSVPTS